MKHPLLVDHTLVTYHRMWKDFNLYSNFYDIDRYPAEGNKVSSWSFQPCHCKESFSIIVTDHIMSRIILLFCMLTNLILISIIVLQE